MQVTKRGNQKEPQLTYALNQQGRMVSIKTVERGLNCNCICPKCGNQLVAKLGKEGGRQWHFAHHHGSDCHGSYMTALHRLAEQIIEEEKKVMVPAYKGICALSLEFKRIEVEKRLERKDLQPDLVGETEDGFRWYIEIRNTHEIDDVKRTKLTESQITCLEIDVREQNLDGLKDFLLLSDKKRAWINNPNYDRYISEQKRKRVSLVENYLLSDKPSILLPTYEEFPSYRIILKEVSILTQMYDGIYSRLLAISSEGTPFIINISYHVRLEDCLSQINDKNNYNELKIYVDDVNPDMEVLYEEPIVFWSYNLLSEKTKESKLKQYKNNPDYEITYTNRCITCKHYPSCKYKKEELRIQGSIFIICDKGKRLQDEDKEYRNNQHKDKLLSNQDEDKVFRNNQEKDFYITELLNRKNSIRSQKTITGKLTNNTLFYSVEIEEYYQLLLETGLFETDEGEKTLIVKCEKAKRYNGIVVLHSINVPIYPFQVSKIFMEGKKLKKCKVSDFTNKTAALNKFNQLLTKWSYNR